MIANFFFAESKVSKGLVSKRSDDVHGLGWGNVTTGFVSKKKLGFLQREMSMERESNEGSPAPRTRGLRVTFAESPSGSRPTSSLGWTVGGVADMDVRAQTPPLAGEWSASASRDAHSVGRGQFSIVKESSLAQRESSFKSSQAATSLSSIQKSSFSSSQSSSFQSSSIQTSKGFEAFPGMNGIENLKIE